MNATISKIRIYPIKSLGHIELNEAEIGTHSLKDDRRFAMVDHTGRYVNGKRLSKVNQLKTVYDLTNNTITLGGRESEYHQTFELVEGNEKLDQFLSEFFDLPINLKENFSGDFMDIPKVSSLTIVSESSLKALQKDINRHSLESLRLRFRTNVELSGVEAFWEERLFQQPDVGVQFFMGDVEMIGMSPRARCNVPPQDPFTGEMDYRFVKHMVESRNQHTLSAKDLEAYGRTTYFLTVIVYLPKSQAGKILKVNDKIEIIKPVSLSMV